MSQPSWLTVTRATGYPRWELVEYDYHDTEDDCNNGGVSAYLKALDAQGNYQAGWIVHWATPDEAVSFAMQPEGNVGYCYGADGKEIPYGIAVPMSGDSSFSPERGESGPYSAYMDGPSDKLSGMGLPLRRHVQFTAVWQWKIEGNEPDPTPDPTPGGEWVIKRQTADRIVLVRR
jgi:hypothetical protein